MDKKEIALEKLRLLKQSGDTEAAHWEADNILLGLIGDAEIKAAWEEVPKWYA